MLPPPEFREAIGFVTSSTPLMPASLEAPALVTRLLRPTESALVVDESDRKDRACARRGFAFATSALRLLVRRSLVAPMGFTPDPLGESPGAS